MADGSEKRPPKRWWGNSNIRILVIGVVAIVAAGVLGGVLGANMSGGSAGKSGCDVAGVSAAVVPSVVTVSVEGESDSGSGSGVIFDHDGNILTNDHVIAAAARNGDLEVVLDDGSSYDADVVGRDRQTDLAVLRIDRKASLPALDWGDSESLTVGEPVVAAGAPLGLSSTITSGVVSGLGRDVPVPDTVLAGAIQTDASINPGNSGGALVTCDGKLVGINTAGASVPSEDDDNGGSAGSVGIGFAVPASVAKPVAEVLSNGERVKHPSFDLDTTPVVDRQSGDGNQVGLRIDKVKRDGAGDDAGLKSGDILVEVEGVAKLQPASLAHLEAVSSVGDTFRVTYYRDGSENQAEITLQS